MAVQDYKGWNLLHHLFAGLIASKLAANIVANMADSSQGMLEGDMRMAMRQKTTGFDPLGATPAHLLCEGSDAGFRKKELIEKLLDAGILVIRDFDIPNNKVFFFGWSFPLVPKIQYTGFQPRRTGFHPSGEGTGFQPS